MVDPIWDKADGDTEENLIQTDNYSVSWKYAEKVIKEDGLGYENEEGINEVSLQELDRALKKRDPHPEW